MSDLLTIHMPGLDLANARQVRALARDLTISTHERGEWCDADRASRYGRPYTPADVLAALRDSQADQSAVKAGSIDGLRFLLALTMTA